MHNDIFGKRLVGRFVVFALALSLLNAGCSTKPSTVPDDAIAFTARPKGKSEDAVMVASADGTYLKQITSTSAGRESLTWSPDGAYLSFVLGYSGPYVMNANGSRATSLEKKYGAIFSAAALWSPVEPLLAFTTESKDSLIGSQIAVLDVAQHKLTVLATGADTPIWSPDGNWLAFRKCPRGSASDPDFVCAIVRVNADGSNERTLADGVMPYLIKWSPDGTRIAFFDEFKKDDLQRVLDVVSADASTETTAVTTITNKATNFPFDFAWSPNGDQLVIANHHGPSDSESYGDLTLTDPSGSHTRVVSDPTWATVETVSWSSDGKSVIFTVDLRHDQVDHKIEVWELDVEHLTKKRYESKSCDSAVSPDGRIVFSDPCDATGALWVSAADGSGRTRIAPNGSSPIWRPKPSKPATPSK